MRIRIEVTIYAAGPLTNIALAIRIDPGFAELTQGIVMMGGSLNPQTDDPEFAESPRHEFNFWFDPEAAHIVLRAHWPRIDVTTVDVSIKAPFTQAMVDEISKSPQSSGAVYRGVVAGSLLPVGRAGGVRVAGSIDHYEGEAGLYGRGSEPWSELRQHAHLGGRDAACDGCAEGPCAAGCGSGEIYAGVCRADVRADAASDSG